MKRSGRLNWGLVIILTLALFIIGSCYYVNEKEEDIIVSTDSIQNDMVIVGGIPIGIYLDTNGVMIIGTEAIEDVEGTCNCPAEDVVEAGDYIVAINDVEVDTKNQLITEVSELDGSTVELEIRRDEEIIEVSLTPTLDSNGDYKLGIWVRDNLQGLGTLTYIDTQSGFGALGHGIHDVDTGELLEIDAGELYKASITGIIKGESGSPGGLEGVIIYNPFNNIGEITWNSDAGIYGTVTDIDALEISQELVEVASTEEIEVGPATIRCTIDDEVCEYEIEILEVNVNETEVNKGLVIQITDEELIELTGGIVQGMSGAPILQNGKLVGAVTHVFVNDPTKGYGIFIENMLETAESVE
ncbi:MAG: SpoIVB peptidase [Eubacteriales bacterium]